MFYSDEEYYADREFLTNSSLKLLHKSPVQFYQWLTNTGGNQSTTALEVGKAFHALCLEDVVNFVGYDGTRRGKEYLQFCEQNDGKIVLSKKDADMIYAMQNVLMKTPQVVELMYNKDDEQLTELPAISEWDGIPIKGKADMVVEKNFEPAYLVDLKTTGGTLEEFRRSAKYMHYDQQAAIYCKLFDVDTFYFVAITKTYPYEVGIYKCSPQLIQQGAIKAQEAIDKYRRLFMNKQFNPYDAAEIGVL